MSIPADSVEEVAVNGATGYLVHGTYYRPTPTSKLVWNIERQVSLFFPLDGWVMEIMTFQPQFWSNEELIKIAESLQPY